MPERSHSDQLNYHNYLDDYYETGFDYYGEGDYFSTPPKNIFERILSNIPTLSERQAGIFPILLGPIFTGIFMLVAFSGKNLKQDFIYFIPKVSLQFSIKIFIKSTSLFPLSRLSVLLVSVTKFFFRLNRLGITPRLLGSTPGLLRGTQPLRRS